jgi:hypothetical protein
MRKKSKGKNQHEWRFINGQDKPYKSTVVTAIQETCFILVVAQSLCDTRGRGIDSSRARALPLINFSHLNSALCTNLEE